MTSTPMSKRSAATPAHGDRALAAACYGEPPLAPALATLRRLTLYEECDRRRAMLVARGLPPSFSSRKTGLGRLAPICGGSS